MEYFQRRALNDENNTSNMRVIKEATDKKGGKVNSTDGQTI